jgi:alpha-L-fucosidase
MHHDGFCLYDSKLSNFNSMQACGRDLTQEIVDAARKRNLKIALYHSLNNWMDQPDAADALEDKAAYEQFIHNTFERIRELVEKFNPIDTLWYDGWWPFNAEGWRGEAMNAMVREIQPHILFNGRNGLDGDFSTPEGHLGAPTPWRPWEASITTNDSWGFHRGDHNWKTARDVVDMLATCAQAKGNLLLNIGPRGCGALPAEATQVLERVGEWLQRNGEAIFDTELWTYSLRDRGEHRGDWSHNGPMTTKGNFLYFLAQRWTESEQVIAGLSCRVQRVVDIGSGLEYSFTQDDQRVVVTGLPETPPDDICPVLRFECDSAPSMQLGGGMRIPSVPHPPYDPCPSDIAHG